MYEGKHEEHKIRIKDSTNTVKRKCRRITAQFKKKLRKMKTKHLKKYPSVNPFNTTLYKRETDNLGKNYYSKNNYFILEYGIQIYLRNKPTLSNGKIISINLLNQKRPGQRCPHRTLSTQTSTLF